MKVIKFDSGFTFDDPNSYWGNPSYQLEAGDPGYVPPPAPINQPKPKRRKGMRHNTYFPLKVGDQVTWLGNFKNKLPGYATPLGLAAGVVTAAEADCDWVSYVLGTWLPAIRAFAEAGTDAATEAQTGDGAALMSLPTFTPPAGGVPTNTGALTRIFDLVQTIKNAAGYTEAIGSDLGVIGSEKSAPDFATFGPVLKITRAPAGITVGWGWQGKQAFLDIIEIQVDRGGGAGWQLLAFDTTPGYNDTEPIPATPVKWQYRAIYRVGDQRVGQWSAAVAVVVGG